MIYGRTFLILVWKLGFKPIPFDKIGLYEDETRASWPVKAEGPPKGWKPRWMVLKEQEEQMVSGELPVFKVQRAGGKIEIDGVVGTEEWTPVQITGETIPRVQNHGPRSDRLPCGCPLSLRPKMHPLRILNKIMKITAPQMPRRMMPIRPEWFSESSGSLPSSIRATLL